MSEWQGVPDDYKDYLGFVYIIEHLSGGYYVGKRQIFKRIRRKPLKGKKRHRICSVESDWRNYWGSSAALLAAIESEGKESFTRTVLTLCKSKRDLAYQELLEQIKRDVLNDPLSWNGMINVRLGKRVGDPIAFARGA